MKRKQYDESFKSEAVKLALSGELSYAEVARNLGVNYATLTNWIYGAMSNPKVVKPDNTTKPTVNNQSVNTATSSIPDVFQSKWGWVYGSIMDVLAKTVRAC